MINLPISPQLSKTAPFKKNATKHKKGIAICTKDAYNKIMNKRIGEETMAEIFLKTERKNPRVYMVSGTNAVIDGQCNNGWKLYVEGGEWVSTFRTKKEALLWLQENAYIARLNGLEVKGLAARL